MALIIKTEGNGVIVNGILMGKEGWLVESDDNLYVNVVNKIMNVGFTKQKIGSITVDGVTPATVAALKTALSTVLFKNGGGAPAEGE